MFGCKTVAASGILALLTDFRIWVLLSCIIILSNKWILERFPFSMALTTWHMFFATICTQILSRTTTLISKPTDMTPRYYFRAVVPIAACFSVSLICSNMVYLYLSMSFIQVLKVCHHISYFLIKVLTDRERLADQWQQYWHVGASASETPNHHSESS